MLQKIKLMLLSASTLFAFALPALAAGTVSADINQNGANSINGSLCSGSNGNLSGTSSTGCGTEAADAGTKLIATVVNVLSLIVGVIAVIMIIVGGLRYITSGGKQESVAGAKNTILYAIVGLVIVALAQLIVHFVLAKTTSATGGAGG